MEARPNSRVDESAPSLASSRRLDFTVQPFDNPFQRAAIGFEQRLAPRDHFASPPFVDERAQPKRREFIGPVQTNANFPFLGGALGALEITAIGAIRHAQTPRNRLDDVVPAPAHSAPPARGR